MNEENFIKFIDSFIGKIKFIRFIRDIENFEEYNSFMRAIIFFDSQDSADNFYYEFNTKSYPTNKFEFLYCAYLDKIYYEYDNLKIWNKDRSRFDIALYFDPYKEQSELFCCPLCLEKIDTSCSGIHTIVNMVNVERWLNFKKNCKVCKQIGSLNKSTPLSFSESVYCLKCFEKANLNEKENSLKNIWCCMICGFTGCDRYQKGHLVEHFNNTLHRYSIDLSSQRIWDYLGDGWVHRLIKINYESEQEQQNATIFLENESSRNAISDNINTKEFLIRMENIVSEYNFVLSSQLEEQRKYYEKEINKLNENYESKLENKKNILDELKNKVNLKKMSAENNKKFIKECQKKLNQQDKKIKDIKEGLELNNEFINNVKSDIIKEDILIQEYNKKFEIEVIENKKNKKRELQKYLCEMYQSLGNDL